MLVSNLSWIKPSSDSVFGFIYSLWLKKKAAWESLLLEAVAAVPVHARSSHSQSAQGLDWGRSEGP